MANATNTKPGFKTTEFWLSLLATLLGFLLASGAVNAADETSAAGRIIGGAVAVLTALGYQVSRTKLKGKADGND